MGRTEDELMAIYQEYDDPIVERGPWPTTGQSPGRPQGGESGEPADDGLVVTGFDENGNPISPPQRVSAEEAKRRTDLWYNRQTFGPTKDPTAGFDQDLGPAPSGRPDYGDAPTFDAPDFEWDGKVPDFDWSGEVPNFNFSGEVPDFQWGEQWQAPSAEAALNDPGYQFRANEGLRGLQNSAAARGLLGSGGTLKDIAGWSQNFAKQEYGDVFNRNLAGYNTRFGTAKDVFDRDLTAFGTKFGVAKESYDRDLGAYHTKFGTAKDVYDRDLGAYNTRFGTAKDVFDRKYTGAKDEYAPKLFEWQTNAHGADLGWRQAWDNYWKDNLSAQDVFNAGGA